MLIMVSILLAEEEAPVFLCSSDDLLVKTGLSDGGSTSKKLLYLKS
jgi:hypothetical protein